MPKGHAAENTATKQRKVGWSAHSARSRATAPRFGARPGNVVRDERTALAFGSTPAHARDFVKTNPARRTRAAENTAAKQRKVGWSAHSARSRATVSALWRETRQRCAG